MRLLTLIVCLPVFLSAQNAKEIIQRALQANERNTDVARQYTFLERQDSQTLDGSGRVKERKIQTWDVTMLEGSSYRRLIARNDKPLPPDEEKREQEKLRKSIEDRRKETDEQRKRRIADWERRQNERRRDFAKELPEAFDFRVAGEERIDGHDAWVIDATPRRGYKGRTSLARAMFPKTICRFWIDKSDFQAVKLDIRTLDTVSLGLFMVRLAKGAHIVITFTRVNDEVWFPKQITLTAAARILLVKGMNLAMQIDYSDYKKFQAESRVVAVEEKKP